MQKGIGVGCWRQPYGTFRTILREAIKTGETLMMNQKEFTSRSNYSVTAAVSGLRYLRRVESGASQGSLPAYMG